MKYSYKSTIGSAISKLQRLRVLPEQGVHWARESAEQFEQQLIENLRNQGRSRAPALSQATRQLYDRNGEPDGSGIRDHIEIRRILTGLGRSGWVVGILQGRPTLIARVQERGATIRVTPKMRGWLSANGIHLKTSTTAIRVPGRRFISRAWDSTHRASRQRLKALFRSAVK